MVKIGVCCMSIGEDYKKWTKYSQKIRSFTAKSIITHL